MLWALVLAGMKGPIAISTASAHAQYERQRLRYASELRDAELARIAPLRNLFSRRHNFSDGLSIAGLAIRFRACRRPSLGEVGLDLLG